MRKRRLSDITPVSPYPYKIPLRKSSWKTILGCLVIVNLWMDGYREVQQQVAKYGGFFKACKSVESLEKPAQLFLLICRSRQ